MAENCKELPEECWELIMNCIPQHTHFEPLSLVCKQFLYLTNRLRRKLSVINETPFIHGKLSSLLKRFPHLRSLDFSNFRGDLNALLLEVSICCLLELEELDFCHANGTPIGFLKELGSNSRCLRVLKCSKVCDLGDNDVVVIANSFPYLEELDVSYPSISINWSLTSMITVTDSGIEALAMNLKNLRKINVSGNHFITDKSLICLSTNCAFLEGVVVNDCTLITSKGVLFLLRNSVNLSAFSVSEIVILGTHLGVEDAITYGRCLCRLELSNAAVSDEFLCLLARIRVPLNSLSLLNCKGFTYSALSLLLCKLQSLQHLALCEVYFLTDECIKELSGYLRNLVTIKLNGCSNLTMSTVYTLVKSCPSLEDLEMECTNLGRDDSFGDFVKYAENVRSLNLARNRYLNHASLSRFALLCPNLETLELSSCSSLVEEGVTEVLNICLKIKHLRIKGNSKITTIGNGSELPKMEELNASYTSINDEGLATIGRRCSRLLKLELEGCGRVTTRGIEEVARQCKRLREINLKGCQNVDVKILDCMVFAMPSLAKIIPPYHSSTTKKQRQLHLRHGCQVAMG